MIKITSIFSILLLVFIYQIAYSAKGTYAPNDIFKPEFIFNNYEEEVRARLEIMDCLITAKIDDDVMDQVKRFVSRDKISTLEILRRTEVYFPLIDQIFKEYNLPVELKYITVVESSLLLGVKSTVGAAGIWQLMPSTAKLLKLSINDKLDQRLDPVLSTHAAARYFQILYGIFGDWSLAIAAYNCGENKVREILENSKAKNFWDIKKQLPRQTQLFIPAFIGVSYLMQYHDEHDINSEFEILNREKITFAKVHKEVNLKDLFKKTNIHKDVFFNLNPGYKRMSIPANSSGLYISLPDSLMVEFVDYYIYKNKKNKLMDVASLLQSDEYVSDHEIISFNRPFQFAPDNIDIHKAQEIQLQFHLNSLRNIKVLPKPESTLPSDYTYHIVKTRESVSEIAENYKVDLEQLIVLNQIDPNQRLKTGTVIKIKEHNKLSL
jgi:membrane-bound lytic murein transglycosylase D